MVLEVVGLLLPYAAGIALSPFAIVGAVLVMSGPRRRVTGPLFAAGWLLGLSGLTAVAVLLGELVGGGEQARWVSALRLLAGVVLVVLGARLLLRSRDGDSGEGPSDEPSWLSGLSDITPRRAFVIGAGLAAANPKNLVFALASASVIGQVDQAGSAAVLEAAVFVVLASSTVLVAVLVTLVGGDPGQRALARVRHTMTRHHDVVLGVVLLLVGMGLTGDALAALG
jgi:threonine/homoserine/homoserine lactone efflux protein